MGDQQVDALSCKFSFAPPAGEISARHLFPLFEVCLFLYLLLLYLTENDQYVVKLLIFYCSGLAQIKTISGEIFLE